MAVQLAEMKRIFEKSVVAASPIRAGTVLTAAMLGVKKPGTGIPAARFHEVVGRRVARDLAADAVVREEDLAP
jgi:N-acetylneuraminate synthase